MQVTLKVPRIHCTGCVNTVTTAVSKLPSVSFVEASEVTNEVKVEFDPTRLSEATIRQQLGRVGYPAE